MAPTSTIPILMFNYKYVQVYRPTILTGAFFLPVQFADPVRYWGGDGKGYGRGEDERGLRTLHVVSFAGYVATNGVTHKLEL